MTRGHQERLAPMAREVLAEAGLDFPAIDRIGVTIGPGSFTGLRVGLAFAKGVALALDRPCVGVGTLEALAASVAGEVSIAAVIDAGRGRVYLQFFERGRPVSAPDILAVEEASARLVDVFSHGEMLLVGPGAALLSGGAVRTTRRDLPAPDPRAVARLAGAAPVIPPRPLYLRPADAKAKAA